MERHNHETPDEKILSDDGSWNPENESDWMDVEDEEDETTSQFQSELMEEEKSSPIASRTRHSTWSIRYHKHENASGVSYHHQTLAKERDEVIKQLETKKINLSRQKSKGAANSNELFLSTTNHKAHMSQTFIPNQITYTFEGIDSRIYNAKFSENGELFLATSQVGTAVFDYSDDNQIKLNKTITCFNVNWAITDSDFTQDNKFMIHSTLSPNIQLFDVENKKYLHQLSVNDGGPQDPLQDGFWYFGMRVYSAKISADGKEVVAGTSRTTNRFAKLQILDVNQNRVSRSINAHDNDVNTVCFVDKLNSSLVITGSDDTLCKLWDIRAFNSNNPVGIFYGHLGGITNVCSKEDGRYFISNSKDQSIKLWDIRKFSTEKKQVSAAVRVDYRMVSLSEMQVEKVKEKMKINKDDFSVSTYFGHEVSDTLIRCHFSPKFITDQRYIYTGSADSCVYIYDILSGENVARLEVEQGNTIRDCAWHPYSQNIMTTDFDGNIYRWEYFDNNKDDL